MEELAVHKKRLEKDLVDKALREYEDGKITREDLKNIADFTIQEMKKVNSKDDLFSFINAISNKWPIFKNIAIIEKGHQKEEMETKVYSEALDQVHDGNIDNAIEIAKKVMD